MAPTPADSGRSSRPRTRRAARIALIGLGSLILLLLLVQVGGSFIATRMVNRRLAELPGYSGRVDSVHLVPWGARVSVRDLVLHSRDHAEEDPVLKFKRASLNLAVASLLVGKLRGEAEIDGLEATVWHEEPPAERKDDKDTKEKDEQARQERLAKVRKWQATLREAFPMEIDRLEIRNGKVRLVDRATTPPAVAEMTELHVVLTDLRNQPAPGSARPASGRITARIAGSGRLDVQVQADPAAEAPEFSAKLELKELSLPEVRHFLRSAAKIDVSSGTFDVYVEVEATGGAYNGYVKPFFRDLEFEPVKDPNQNPVKRVAGEVVDAVTDLLKNEDEKVATRAPFQGNFADNKVDVWTTVENLLRNAFVQSLTEGLEGGRSGED